ncbi:hypothetical protein EDD85DRAFT_936527 [Armillaria nabsnona]|nr:hypothetical protein EDD85DRAFT_936527 [Armillaria nabsnona]
MPKGLGRVLGTKSIDPRSVLFLKRVTRRPCALVPLNMGGTSERRLRSSAFLAGEVWEDDSGKGERRQARNGWTGCDACDGAAPKSREDTLPSNKQMHSLPAKIAEARRHSILVETESVAKFPPKSSLAVLQLKSRSLLARVTWHPGIVKCPSTGLSSCPSVLFGASCSVKLKPSGNDSGSFASEVKTNDGVRNAERISLKRPCDSHEFWDRMSSLQIDDRSLKLDAILRALFENPYFAPVRPFRFHPRSKWSIGASRKSILRQSRHGLDTDNQLGALRGELSGYALDDCLLTRGLSFAIKHSECLPPASLKSAYPSLRTALNAMEGYVTGRPMFYSGADRKFWESVICPGQSRNRTEIVMTLVVKSYAKVPVTT